MAESGVEVALDGALPLGRPDGLDQLFAARLQPGGGGEIGQDLEGAPQPAVEIALPVLVPLPGERAPQQAEDVDREAVARALGGGGRRQRRPGGARRPLPAPLARQQGGEEPRQPVALRALHPEAEGVDHPPGLFPGAAGGRPLLRGGEKELALLLRQGLQHLLPEEEAHGRQVQQGVRSHALQPWHPRGVQGEPQRPVPAIRGLP